MEIERKYLVKQLPEKLSAYPHRIIEQGYLSTEPVIRIRKDGDKYELTYKSKGLMIREEYNLPLTQSSYEHLKPKTDGYLITKERYNIPYHHLTIELDCFLGQFSPLILAEVEFPDEESANAFVPPDWFGEDVTFSPAYQNSSLSQKGPLR
ncbi:MAG: CYTH domain-containing protein [Lachnospiraceae bacterium]|nr:CYTH domain-containing protein [Lachnospiraceae bacterium]